MPRLLLLLAIAACSSSHGPSNGGNRASAEPDLGCVQDAQTRDGCAAKGSAYVYRSDPARDCYGTDPGPEVMRQEAEARRKEKCVCIEAAVAKQRDYECSITP